MNGAAATDDTTLGKTPGRSGEKGVQAGHRRHGSAGL